MGIAQTVEALAKAVLDAPLSLEPRHLLVLELFQLMPQYLAFGDLSLWDRACRDVIGDGVGPTDSLIWTIFDFADTNLYAAYRLEATQEAFQDVVAEFNKHEILVPSLAPDALES